MPDVTRSAGFDVVIVGAGTAGCVLANRLSARRGIRVLLLEAGPDYLPGQEPAEIRDSYPYFAANNWNHLWPDLRVWLSPVSDKPDERPAPTTYRQARIVGGGSSINGILAIRGTPSDYDGWANAGATGWDWQSVLPYFLRLERDLDFSGELHGSDGPLPISRVPRSDWPGFPAATASAFTELGYHRLEDHNAEFSDGWFPLAVSTDGTHRVSAAMGYLDAAARRRPNLTIRPRTAVEGLVLESGRAVGVRLAGEIVRAREVVLCAGALQSPVFLLRAGIGPAAELAAAGITAVCDLPGVGHNLREHPGISMSAYIPPRLRQPPTMRRHAHLGLRYSSRLPGMPAGDLYMVVLSKSAWHPVGRRIGSLFTWINKPFSTGTVCLDPRAVEAPPHIRFELLSDPRDFARMKVAFRAMAEVFAASALASVTRDAAVSTHGALAQIVGRKSARNWLMTLAPALLMDGPAPLRRMMMELLVTQGNGVARVLSDEARLDEIIRRRTIGGWHPCGTCRMGQPNDPGAVVDPATAGVHGVGGLSVVDASIMPDVPRANTNIPTAMVAEKMADAILQRLAG